MKVRRLNGTRTHKVRTLDAANAANICDPRREKWTGNCTIRWDAVTCRRCLAKRRQTGRGRR